MTAESYWLDTATLPRFGKLAKDLTVDVAVIGGGLTGITAAYLLKKAGLSVALLERDRCGRADTGHTTAHLTYATDERLHQLVKSFGRDHARAVWDAGQAAIEQMQALVEEHQIDCGFSWAPGYLHLPWSDDQNDEKAIRSLEEDARLAREFGFAADFVDCVPLARRPGVRFANQAMFHPLQYLAALLRMVPRDGGHVFEHTEVSEFQDQPLALKANGHTVSCGYVVIATHVPLMGNTGIASATLFQTKIAPYSSYVVGAELPRDTVPEALWWDTVDPYHYLRVERRPRHDFAIFGGEDHKTGQSADPTACFTRLEETLTSLLPKAKVTQRWTGQVVESHDGLPYIGETAEHQFIATGFAGNGMTFGTLASMMAVDAVQGRKNPWKDLFDVGRKKLSGAWDYIKENADYPYYFVKDRLSAAEGTTLDSVKSGEGKILKLDGQRVAAYRSPQGKVSLLSPNCTHMGCLVRWNAADSTWDCPCHGSRFQATGEVFAGPAETSLEKTPEAKK